MKIYTTLILASIFLFKMGVDAGSFNLSGSFNPGISFSRSQRLNKQDRNHEHGNVDNLDWPQPVYISYFKTNRLLLEPAANEAIPGDNERSQPHHYRSSHRTHKRSI